MRGEARVQIVIGLPSEVFLEASPEMSRSPVPETQTRSGLLALASGAPRVSGSKSGIHQKVGNIHKKSGSPGVFV